MIEHYTPPAAALKELDAPAKSRYVHALIAAASAFVTLPLLTIVISKASGNDPTTMHVGRVFLISALASLLVGVSVLPIRNLSWYLAIPIGAVLCPLYVLVFAVIFGMLTSRY